MAVNPNVYTSKYGTKINVKGITGKPLKKIQSLADSRYGTKAQALAKRLRIPKASTPVTVAPTPTPEPVPNPIQPINFNNTASGGPSANPQTASPGTTQTLFPSTRIFEPQNYEGSPLYKFQLQEGQKQLARSLAARGLTNSGHAIEQELNLPLRVAAQDTDRMTRMASENADRLKSFQDNEALRLERAGNNQWDRAYSLATLMAAQSPWQGALGGLNNSAEATSAAGQAQANFLRDYYRRIIAAGGGGGGGSGAVPIPLPSGPDYTNIIPTEINSNASSNNGWLNIAQGLLNSLF